MRCDSESKLFRKFVLAAKLMHIYLNHFPKFEKFGICQEIRRSMYSCYTYMVECQKRYHKKTAISNLDIAHEQWRMLVDLSEQLGYFEYTDSRKIQDHFQRKRFGLKRFLAMNRLIDELGRMIGSWKSLIDSQ